MQSAARDTIDYTFGTPVHVSNPDGSSPVLLVCEHATSHLAPDLGDLGLSEVERLSHIAWDPGAKAVAERLSQRLDAALVHGGVSRLVYDCNRPPSAPDAIPARSELTDIPGNTGLADEARAARISQVYVPFRNGLARQIAACGSAVLVTIHTFTPTYKGQAREVEIGVLHDADRRLADAMLRSAARHTDMKVARNQPYGPQDGVTHTLKEHALPLGHANVMLEIRNDLVVSEQAQLDVADMLAAWLVASLGEIGVTAPLRAAE